MSCWNGRRARALDARPPRGLRRRRAKDDLGLFAQHGDSGRKNPPLYFGSTCDDNGKSVRPTIARLRSSSSIKRFPGMRGSRPSRGFVQNQTGAGRLEKRLGSSPSFRFMPVACTRASFSGERSRFALGARRRSIRLFDALWKPVPPSDSLQGIPAIVRFLSNPE